MASERYHSEETRDTKTASLRKIVSAVLLVPTLVWSFTALYSLVRNGIYSNASLFPFSFRVHALSLLNMAVFYIVIFLIILPRRPLRSFSIPLSLLFLSNAVYELIYGVLYDWTSLQVTLPFTAAGIAILSFINKRFHFLKRDEKGILRFGACFSIFIAIMLTLNQTGFFTEMRLYLTGQTTNDPHNPLWIISKALSVWMFSLLLSVRSTETLS